MHWISAGGNEPAEANFSVSDETPPVAAPVLFINGASGNQDYAWDFGDGTTSTATNPEHIFTTPGTYTITLVATNACSGLIDTYTSQVMVQAFSEVSINPTSFTQTIPFGDLVQEDLIICNDGDGDLYYTLDGAALISNKGLSVLALINTTDVEHEYETLIESINTHFTDYELSEITTYSAIELAAALEGKDIFILTEQIDCDPALYAEFGEVLSTFANNGGTVIIQGTEDASQCVFSTGLIHGSYAPNTTTNQVLDVIAPDDPLLEGITLPYQAQSVTYLYDISDPDFVSVLELNGLNAIGYRPMGDGRVIFVGHDFLFANANMKKFIANAISQSGDVQLGNWLFVSEDTGTVPPGACDTVTVEFDAIAGLWWFLPTRFGVDDQRPRRSPNQHSHHLGCVGYGQPGLFDQ